jgi:hypothetical protein
MTPAAISSEFPQNAQLTQVAISNDKSSAVIIGRAPVRGATPPPLIVLSLPPP